MCAIVLRLLTRFYSWRFLSSKTLHYWSVNRPDQTVGPPGYPCRRALGCAGAVQMVQIISLSSQETRCGSELFSSGIMAGFAAQSLSTHHPPAPCECLLIRVNQFRLSGVAFALKKHKFSGLFFFFFKLLAQFKCLNKGIPFYSCFGLQLLKRSPNP